MEDDVINAVDSENTYKIGSIMMQQQTKSHVIEDDEQKRKDELLNLSKMW